MNVKVQLTEAQAKALIDGFWDAKSRACHERATDKVRQAIEAAKLEDTLRRSMRHEKAKRKGKK